MGEKLDYIRRKCIEANPEIVELKFGCEFVDKLTGKTAHVIGDRLLFGADADYTFELFVFDKEINQIHLTQGGSNKIYNAKYEEVGSMDVEVIGRPIRLVDVLLAIEAKYGVGSFEANYQQWGWPWNLRADDLTAQSPETVDFLYQLLGGV